MARGRGAAAHDGLVYSARSSAIRVELPKATLTDAAGPAYAPFIVAEFSEVVSATTVTTETVQLLEGGGQPVSVTVTYNGVFNQAVIVPREPLQDNTRYTVIVSQGVKDLIGNPMEADYTWSFSIGAPFNQIYLPVILKSYSQ